MKEEKMLLTMNYIVCFHRVWQWIYLTDKTGFLLFGTHCIGQCSCTQVCGWNGCCAWLWLWTGLITLHILLIWHYLFSVPQHEKPHLAEKQYLTDDEVIFCSWALFRGSGWELLYIPRESKRCNTNGRSVWTAGETMLKYKYNYIWSNSTIAS